MHVGLLELTAQAYLLQKSNDCNRVRGTEHSTKEEGLEPGPVVREHVLDKDCGQGSADDYTRTCQQQHLQMQNAVLSFCCQTLYARDLSDQNAVHCVCSQATTSGSSAWVTGLEGCHCMVRPVCTRSGCPWQLLLNIMHAYTRMTSTAKAVGVHQQTTVYAYISLSCAVLLCESRHFMMGNFANHMANLNDCCSIYAILNFATCKL